MPDSQRCQVRAGLRPQTPTRSAIWRWVKCWLFRQSKGVIADDIAASAIRRQAQHSRFGHIADPTNKRIWLCQRIRQMQNRIAEIRKSKRLSQQALADAVGSHWITISKLERGVMQLTSSWIDRLASALSVKPEDLISKGRSIEEINFWGFIEEGGEVDIESGDDRHIKSFTPKSDDFVSFWLMVSEDALAPFCNHGDIIRFVTVDESEAEHYLKKLCMAVVKESDGNRYGYVGFLNGGSRSGLFTIRPAVGKPIRDLILHELHVASELRFMMPWDKIDETVG
ncbi:helix-turn-helix domain-containing protein [Hansschlegelia zhihuaiae]|uniref:XRE family transcriptional regulator n=1 Tax=Hansschlegelia zhihuaiae TaxID=405005 RepID=A0A4Q0M3W2_9HYPH|nr:helix-turn-helix transcriptional regulator [Hansschlegelia zhihuaiae]RXF67555.1 XRE family transcriptional regulator [Hansschlegelia zhihuaiae]